MTLQKENDTNSDAYTSSYIALLISDMVECNTASGIGSTKRLLFDIVSWLLLSEAIVRVVELIRVLEHLTRTAASMITASVSIFSDCQSCLDLPFLGGRFAANEQTEQSRRMT
jgi:hypothetical protein